jgi:hypothetical protein
MADEFLQLLKMLDAESLSTETKPIGNAHGFSGRHWSLWKTKYYTKVVAQSLQFLPDNTTGDTVTEKGKVIDEGEFELREAS